MTPWQARKDWGWKHEYDIDALVAFMLKRLSEIKKTQGK